MQTPAKPYNPGPSHSLPQAQHRETTSRVPDIPETLGGNNALYPARYNHLRSNLSTPCVRACEQRMGRQRETLGKQSARGCNTNCLSKAAYVVLDDARCKLNYGNLHLLVRARDCSDASFKIHRRELEKRVTRGLAMPYLVLDRSRAADRS